MSPDYRNNICSVKMSPDYRNNFVCLVTYLYKDTGYNDLVNKNFNRILETKRDLTSSDN